MNTNKIMEGVAQWQRQKAQGKVRPRDIVADLLAEDRSDRGCLSDETIAQCVDGTATWRTCFHAFRCQCCRETIIDVYRFLHPEEKRLPLWTRMAQLGHSTNNSLLQQMTSRVGNTLEETETGLPIALISSTSELFERLKKDFQRHFDDLRENIEFQKRLRECSKFVLQDIVEATAPGIIASETPLASFTAIWEKTDGKVRDAQVDLLEAPLITPKGYLATTIRVRDTFAKPTERIALVMVRSDGEIASEVVEVRLDSPQTITIPLPPDFRSQKAWLNYADFPFRFVILALVPEADRTDDYTDRSMAWYAWVQWRFLTRILKRCSFT